MLEQLDLYSARVVTTSHSGMTCRCRFNHIFKYNTIDDWCNICKGQDFQDSVISEINEEFTSGCIPFKLFEINCYGVARMICPFDHIYRFDIDEIPNECDKCTKTQIYDLEYSSDLQIVSSDDGDVDISLKVGSSDDGYRSDSFGDICCDDWFTQFENLSDNDTYDNLSHQHNEPSHLNMFKEFELFNINWDDQGLSKIFVNMNRKSEFRSNNIKPIIKPKFNTIH
jgi:hypothetical protein